MSASDNQEIDRLKEAIAALQAQREVLDESVVDALIQASENQLAKLQKQAEYSYQQRKLATILFADVVGSTSLGQYLEPDEILEVMDAALKRLAGPVEKNGGHVTRFQGDGFKAVFGVPVAHENDPEQAVRAGLSILAVAREIERELNEDRGISNFNVRVGVNTGLVASGGETEAGDTVMGRAVNLAARLESAAPPNGMLISHFTYQHVRGVFDVDVLPPIRAKGFEEPVSVYLVKQAKPRSSRVLSRGVEGVETRMVGRQAELKYLQDALLTAIEEGEGQVVTVSGDAGVGKSRLMFEFQNWIELLPGSVDVYQGQARLASQHLPYALIRDIFVYRFQIQDSDPPHLARDKIESGLEQVFRTQPSARFVRGLRLNKNDTDLENKQSRSKGQPQFIGQLLGFDFADSPYLKAHLQDPQALRNRGMNSLQEYFTASSQQGPVVVLLEDVHWADDSSMEAIKDLGRLTVENPLVLVCLARPSLYEKRPYWGEGKEYHRKLDLQPLSKRESRQLVEEILQYVEQVPLELRELVVKGAEGNPFYIEELIKMLIEQEMIVRSEISQDGVEKWRVVDDILAQIKVPSTLTGVLQARLDGLNVTERNILQQAAVVGRIFWDQVIAYMHSCSTKPLKSEQLESVLRNLREKEMIFRREDSSVEGAQEYTFKHDVLREVTYDTVLLKDRKTYHSLVADWLLTSGQARLGEFSGLVAEHLELAGRAGEAAGYFLQAGDQSLANYANAEAQGYYHRALNLNPSPEHRLCLLTGIGQAAVRQGYYEQGMQDWEQGMQICHQLNDLEGLVRLYNLAMHASATQNPKRAIELSQQVLAFEHRLKESSILAHLYHQVGRVYHFSGLLKQASQYCQLALEMGERLGDVEVQADAQVTLGILPDNTDEENLQALTKAVELAESHDLLYIHARARHNLALLTSRDLGDFQTGLIHAMKAAELQHLRGEIEWELNALTLALIAELHLGNLYKAGDLIAYIDSRFNPFPGLDEVKQQSFRWLAKFKVMRGEWLPARDIVIQALEKAMLADHPQHLFDVFAAVTLPVYLEIDRFLEKPDWAEIESIFNRVIDRPGEKSNSTAYSLMSSALSRQGRLEEANNLWLKGKQQLRDYPTFINRMSSRKAEIELAVANKQWDIAEAELISFTEFMESVGHRWEFGRALLEWGDVCLARGDTGDMVKARDLYRKSLELFTEIGADGYTKVVKERLHSLN